MLPQLAYADCFSILGLSTNATNEQIKVAYKRLVSSLLVPSIKAYLAEYGSLRLCNGTPTDTRRTKTTPLNAS